MKPAVACGDRPFDHGGPRKEARLPAGRTPPAGPQQSEATVGTVDATSPPRPDGEVSHGTRPQPRAGSGAGSPGYYSELSQKYTLYCGT